MNRAQAKAVASYVKAFGDGEDVQIDHAMDGWITKEEMSFTSDSKSYRIKPKPREFWAGVDENGKGVGITASLNSGSIPAEWYEVIKVCEVLS